jgi:hypothetical protein
MRSRRSRRSIRSKRRSRRSILRCMVHEEIHKGEHHEKHHEEHPLRMSMSARVVPSCCALLPYPQLVLLASFLTLLSTSFFQLPTSVCLNALLLLGLVGSNLCWHPHCSMIPNIFTSTPQHVLTHHSASATPAGQHATNPPLVSSCGAYPPPQLLHLSHPSHQPPVLLDNAASACSILHQPSTFSYF